MENKSLLLVIALLLLTIAVTIFQGFFYAREISTTRNELKETNASMEQKISQLEAKISEIEVQAMSAKKAEEIISKTASEVINAIRDEDFETLSGIVHPEKGVRFSPYGHVDVQNDLVFTPLKVKDLANDSTVYNWGVYDGSGQPIELSFKDYYNRFVYDKDFANARVISFNQIIGRGNIINNIFDVYPGCITVEYHFPGFDPKYEGMDWRSLILVFERKNDAWYLVGVIHSEWTI